MFHFLRAGRSRFLAFLISFVMISAAASPGSIVYADETGGGSTTTTWNFKGGEEGAYSGTIEGTTGEFNGIQIDASTGKCAARAGDTQVNAGTKLSVSVSGSAIIMVDTYPGYHNYTINGIAADKDNFQYTYTGGEGYVDIVAADTVYLYQISRVYSSAPEDTPDTIDYDKADVWDFGAEQLDTSKYINKLTADTINGLYTNTVSPGALSINIASFSTSNGEFLFNDGGYPSTHRLRSTNTALTRYDNKSLKSADQTTTYTGYIYSNKEGTSAVYLGVKLYKNDILTLCVSSNGSPSTINVEAPDGSIVKKVFALGGSTAEAMTFYAAGEGIYKVYSTDEKLVVARVYREHSRTVAVNGTVSAPDSLSGYSITFTNRQTGEAITAPVIAGTYSTVLNEKYDYDVSLSNAYGYIIIGSLSIAAGAGNQTFDAAVAAVSLVKVTGSITGLTAKELGVLNLKLTSGSVYVPVVDFDANGAYTMQLEKGISYTVIAEGVNDYRLTADTISADADTAINIEFREKAKYPVTVNVSGINDEIKNGSAITFTNINEPGYSYSFPLSSTDIVLRDGQYKVTVKGTGTYAAAMEDTPNLIMNGTAGNVTVNYSPLNNWNFAVFNGTAKGPGIETIGGSNYYLGLKLSSTGVSENKIYLLLKSGGTIDVPVKQGDVVTVSYCYNAAFQFNDDTATAVDSKSGSTSKLETAKYTAAADGFVTIRGITGTNSTQTYLTDISVTTPIPYKAAITVGASGCDYTTITDALSAVKAMSRPNNERVTIGIQPGNYEEMLVIDMPNITLKNAGSSPSIALTNKGAGIAVQAVRITSYYGHGYNYYSMGSGYKYDAKALAVNKANGYSSVVNPGAGNISYWNATVVISGSGFKAEGIIFENSYNQYISQKEADDIVTAAVANMKERPKTAGDTSVQDKSFVERAAALAITDNVKEVYFDNCRFVGRQDTLYGGAGTVAAFYKCAVMGACDYIFGGMTAVFYKCRLVMNTSEAGTDAAYLTAAQQSTGRGYLMYNCTVTGTTPGVDTASAKKSKPGYLGRPWMPNSSEVVFYKTIIEATDFSGKLESMIQPAGWLSTLGGTSPYMYEYGTMECLKGTDNSANRVSWSTKLTEPKLSDNTDISTTEKAVSAFLGSWNAFTPDAADDAAVIVEPEPVTPPTIYTLNANDMEEKTYSSDYTTASGYFTITANSKSTVTVDPNAKSADGLSFTKRIKLGGTGTKDYRSIKFTASAEAAVKIYAMSSSSGSDRTLSLYKADGTVVDSVAAKGTVLEPGTIQITEKGDYYLASPESGVNVYCIIVTVQGSSPVPDKTPWSDVAAPVILSAAQNGNKMIITFNLVTGDKGADKATVDMSDDKGVPYGSITVGADASTAVRSAEFIPAASGNYTFKVTASRDGETTVKESSSFAAAAFNLPLSAPVIKGAVNKGSGKVEIIWNAVKEAQSYAVSYKAENAANYIAAAEVTQTSAIVSGLTAGVKYIFAVKAFRGTDESDAAETSLTITDKEERAWFFSAFGQGVDTSTNYCSGNANEGSVTVASEGGKGKLVPASTDGLAFCYTAIDADKENFTLSATVNVDSWTYSNGQEGFGLMAADAVGINGDSLVFWNNSFMNSVTKVEYYWDQANNKVSDTGDKITMKLGIGAQSKTGVTAANIADGSIVTDINTLFHSTMAPLDTSCAASGTGTYNIAGNYKNTSAPSGTIDTPVTSFKLSIQRDNTGYRLSYTDKDGKTVTKLYYDTARNALTQIDKDNIYVGFFASRNAKITVTDIMLTTKDPADDPPAEEEGVTYVSPSYRAVSSETSGTADYELIFIANADGKVTIENNNAALVTDQAVTANTYVKKKTVLTMGMNHFNIKFTPDKNYKPGDKQLLSSYDTANISHTVTYKTYVRNEIYVSQNGTQNGTGSRNNPLDIYTAINYAKPGQKIILAGGIYNMTSALTVPRGINGTAGSMIYMIADPANSIRPVFQFNRLSAGMIFAGDYWYLQGFDVTGSADTQKGIQMSGDYCTLDNVNAYYNGNTGIQISRYDTADTYEDWPSHNLVLNCTSFANADKGYEDADGFAAKLTVGDGNVFDGCISYNNADDGWDLFAKVETGAIGPVVIRNCVAYGNGYLPDGTIAGNGNGFKLGGSSITGHHKLINCIAYNNKAKGIDSNSCPDIIVTQCTSLNNGSYNVAFYTSDAANTDFEAGGVISYRTQNSSIGNTSISDNIKPKGTQDTAKIYKISNYYWDGSSGLSKNTSDNTVSENWFTSTDTGKAILRNSDKTINMNGLLVLTEKAPVYSGARMSGNPSAIFSVTGDSTGGNNTIPTAAPSPSPVPEKNKDMTDYDLKLKLPKNTEGEVYWSDIIKDIKKLTDNGGSTAGGKKPQKIKLDMNGATRIPQDLLSLLQGQDIDVTLDLGNGISWTINGRDIKDKDIKEVDLGVSLHTDHVPAASLDQLQPSGSRMPDIQLSLVHEGSFGFNAELRLDVSSFLESFLNGDLSGIDRSNLIAGIYYYDPVTAKLILQSSSRVNEDGTVNFSFHHASDYVILYGDKLIPDEQTLADIKVNGVKTGETAKAVLYVGGTTGKSLQLKPDIPESIREAADKGLINFKAEYSSSDESVAYVTGRGRIIPINTGTAFITVKLSVGDKLLKFKTKVTVKEACIRFVKTEKEVKAGRKVTFKVEVYGISEADIIWSTSRKNIAVTGMNKGRTSAVITGKSAGTDTVIVKMAGKGGSRLRAEAKITVK